MKIFGAILIEFESKLNLVKYIPNILKLTHAAAKENYRE